MIPEARLQEIERRANDAKKWRGDSLVHAAIRGFGTDACDLVAEVRRLREALERYENEAPDWLKPIARAALTEESEEE